MARIRKLGNLPFICRIDQPEKRTYGWYLRINYQTAATEGYAKFFSDGKYGGKTESLLAAVADRDEKLGVRRLAA